MFEEFLGDLDADSSRAVAMIIDHVAALVPEAEEGRSYGLAAFIWHDKPLLGFNATATHLSLYPFSPAAVDAVRPQLEGFRLSKGTLRFTPDRPVPLDAVTTLVQRRMEEIAGD
ncbi:iron chaperone [Euzebya sp.]|uniref:iron chaperone n=1 Tax=Euzebya sp. TaxID=1971409 RepID=UPI0035142142